MHSTFDIVEFIAICVGIVTVILFVLAFMQVGYYIKGSTDSSLGTIYCNNEKIYSGKLYRVEYELQSKSLRTPMFFYSVKSPKWVFITEQSGFCDLFCIAKEE